MLSRFVLAAVVAVSAGVSTGVSVGWAQSVAEIGGPAELPPSSFTGQQYVDSRGCVFLRAGLGGRTNWAPRLDRSRRVLCGYPPTFGSRPVAVAAAEPEPLPAPPAPVAVAPAPAAAPVVAAPQPTRVAVAPPAAVVAAPARSVQTAIVPATGSSGRQIGCFTNTPVPVRVQLTNGGSAVLCTRGDGTLEGARAPIYPPGSGVGASLTEPNFGTTQGTGQPARVVAPAATTRTAAAVPTTPPPGYRAAWQDDRLNPNRGVGTATGQAQQDQVWTREVPARLVTQAAPAASGVQVSTKTEPTAAVAPQATGTFYVQVGTFGVASNAAGARDRLNALGLATARSNTTRNGQALTIVLAGPFGTSGEAQSALRAARGAGFSDAFIR